MDEEKTEVTIVVEVEGEEHEVVVSGSQAAVDAIVTTLEAELEVLDVEEVEVLDGKETGASEAQDDEGAGED